MVISLNSTFRREASLCNAYRTWRIRKQSRQSCPFFRLLHPSSWKLSCSVYYPTVAVHDFSLTSNSHLAESSKVKSKSASLTSPSLPIVAHLRITLISLMTQLPSLTNFLLPMSHLPQLRNILPRPVPPARPATMGLPPTPRSTPPASTTMPPPRLVTPPKAPERKEKQEDQFLSLYVPHLDHWDLDSDQAADSKAPPLPSLLGPRSITYPWLSFALTLVPSAARSSIWPLSSRKRKFSPSVTEGKEVTTEDVKDEDMETKQGAEKKRPVMKFDGIDPNVFGLFLRFIYAGGYNAQVDARPVTAAPMTRRPDAIYPSPYPAGTRSAPASITTAPGPSNNSNTIVPPHKTFADFTNKIAPNKNYISPETALAVLNPSPPVQDLPIPPSIHAYLLAQRLQSITFMNHTLIRIYSAIGVHFTLSPSLIDFVWANTNTSPGTVRSACAPLRKLLLDILIMHWPTHHTHIITRNDDDAWNAVFDAHQDLRRGFILGLQGGTKVMPVQGYFVQAGMVLKQEGQLKDIKSLNQ
jgi:hypothetical protein